MKPPHRFWLVQGRGPARYRHDDYPSAKDEAQRLARMNPGEKFVVLESVSAHVKIDVEDMQIDEGAESAIDVGDEIPF